MTILRVLKAENKYVDNYKINSIVLNLKAKQTANLFPSPLPYSNPISVISVNLLQVQVLPYTVL